MEDDDQLYSKEELIRAIAAASRDKDHFLTVEDIENIAAEVGVPGAAVRRELARIRSQAHAARGDTRTLTSDDVAAIAVGPPGFRAPVLMQLGGLAVLASVTMYWLRNSPMVFIGGFAALWVYSGAVIVSFAHRSVDVEVRNGTMTLRSLSWWRDDYHEFQLSDRIEVDVVKSGEQMTVEFFPMYYLRVQSGGHRANILFGHEVATLENVRKWIVEHARPYRLRAPDAGPDAA